MGHGGQGSRDLVLNCFCDSNSHFTELLGGHVEGGIWRGQPEALQNFGNHLHHHLTWKEQFGAGSLPVLLGKVSGILLSLADDLGKSVGYSHSKFNTTETSQPLYLKRS